MSVENPIIDFGDPQATDVSLVGAKVARLVESADQGFQTPRGFAVSTSAFLGFMNAIDDGGLVAEINAFEADDIGDAKAFETRMVDAVMTAAISSKLAEAIRAAYESLCFTERHVDCPVAVRSSATGEDAKDASFAGQYESYLGVSGTADLIEAIRRGWASLFTERALLYRRKTGLAYSQTPMALGVMTLVDARAAGVGFSAHPVRGTHDRMVVESTFGFGEALVQGLVTPDHFELDKESLRLLERTIGDKAIVSVLDTKKGAVVERPMPHMFQPAASLTDEELAAVGDLLRQIEIKAGHPVDIEWVIPHGWRAGQAVMLVQVRPITAMGEQTEQAPTETAKPQTFNPGAFASKYTSRRRRR